MHAISGVHKILSYGRGGSNANYHALTNKQKYFTVKWNRGHHLQCLHTHKNETTNRSIKPAVQYFIHLLTIQNA